MKELIENIKKLWIYIKDDKKNLILIILGHILQIIISIILPILSAKILVEITSNEYIRVLVIAIILLFVDDRKFFINCSLNNFLQTVRHFLIQLYQVNQYSFSR